MAYVKLDCGMLDSTLWIDRAARELFITALLMAEPYELAEPMEAIAVREIKKTGFVVPPGWYGFVHAAGTGIIHRAMMDQEIGFVALERLAEPESESRTPDFGGRRMVRVDGGYIVLNFDKYRNKDHTAAERSRRYRERKAKEVYTSRVTPRSSRVSNRSVTQAEAEVQAEAGRKEFANANSSAPSDREITAEDIWKAYPLKKEKPQTIKVINAQIKKFGAQLLLDRTKAYAEARDGNLDFVPYPQKWFKREGFNDDPSTWEPRAQQNRANTGDIQWTD